MKVIISPAKSLDFEKDCPRVKTTQPMFPSEAEKLSTWLKKKSARQLSTLMRISPALGQLNFERNQAWSLPFTDDNSKPAIFAFQGAVYQAFDQGSLPASLYERLQNTLRILSGQYGLLRPFDLIQAYRLEMSTRVKIGRKNNLYEFWGDKITTALNDDLAEDEPLINLASKEYFKAVDFKKIKSTVVTPVFKDLKNGEYKVIMTYAKLARGHMLRYIIDMDCKAIEDLKGFDREGYAFDANLSTETEFVFTR
ncbi:peroxide stress protein YaaA [Flavobacteriaceae bacterium F08102]|nr:peroxide stress protein YaaA [Flavobacteriaceae bacterium F08102]